MPEHHSINDQHLNPNGVVHGGLIFSLIDTVMGAASFIRRGRHLVHVESEVLDDLGQIVAVGTGTFTVIYPE